jgi:hypothetical protein
VRELRYAIQLIGGQSLFDFVIFDLQRGNQHGHQTTEVELHTLRHKPGGNVSGYVTLSQLCSTASENRFLKMLLNAARELRHRWRVLRFGRRLYDQACGTQLTVLDSPRTVPVQDFSEHLFRRSVSPRIHDLVQLRVASLIASAAQTKLRADLCRE